MITLGHLEVKQHVTMKNMIGVSFGQPFGGDFFYKGLIKVYLAAG